MTTLPFHRVIPPTVPNSSFRCSEDHQPTSTASALTEPAPPNRDLEKQRSLPGLGTCIATITADYPESSSSESDLSGVQRAEHRLSPATGHCVSGDLEHDRCTASFERHGPPKCRS